MPSRDRTITKIAPASVAPRAPHHGCIAAGVEDAPRNRRDPESDVTRTQSSRGRTCPACLNRRGRSRASWHRPSRSGSPVSGRPEQRLDIRRIARLSGGTDDAPSISMSSLPKARRAACTRITSASPISSPREAVWTVSVAAARLARDPGAWAVGGYRHSCVSPVMPSLATSFPRRSGSGHRDAYHVLIGFRSLPRVHRPRALRPSISPSIQTEFRQFGTSLDVGHQRIARGGRGAPRPRDGSPVVGSSSSSSGAAISRSRTVPGSVDGVVGWGSWTARVDRIGESVRVRLIPDGVGRHESEDDGQRRAATGQHTPVRQNPAAITRCGGIASCLSSASWVFALLARANACFPVFFLFQIFDLRQGHRSRQCPDSGPPLFRCSLPRHAARTQSLHQAETQSGPLELPRIVVADLHERLSDCPPVPPPKCRFRCLKPASPDGHDPYALRARRRHPSGVNFIRI